MLKEILNKLCATSSREVSCILVYEHFSGNSVFIYSESYQNLIEDILRNELLVGVNSKSPKLMSLGFKNNKLVLNIIVESDTLCIDLSDFRFVGGEYNAE